MNRLACRFLSERLAVIAGELAALAADLEPLIRRAELEVPSLAAFDARAAEHPAADMQAIVDTIDASAMGLRQAVGRILTMQAWVLVYEGRLRAEEEGIVREEAAPAEARRDAQEAPQVAARRRALPRAGTLHYPACGPFYCVSGCPWLRTEDCRGCLASRAGIGHATDCDAYVG